MNKDTATRQEPSMSLASRSLSQEGQIRDQMIIECLQRASPMLRSMAFRYAQDYDEVYQVAAEAALSAYKSAQQADNPYGYLYRAMCNALLSYIGPQTLASHYRIVSLDAPLTDDPTFSLQDVISEPAPLASEERDFSILYTLLATLPTTYRETICLRFGLSGYGQASLSEIVRMLGVSKNTVQGRFYRALAALRKHPELLDEGGA